MNIQHRNGALSELKAAQWFIARGHEVYQPMLGQARADFVADVDGVLQKVQVKTATWSTTGKYEYLQVRLVSRDKYRRAYTAEDFDVLVVVDGDTQWHIPFAEVEGRTSLYLATTNPSPNKSNRDYDPTNWLTH